MPLLGTDKRGSTLATKNFIRLCLIRKRNYSEIVLTEGHCVPNIDYFNIAGDDTLQLLLLLQKEKFLADKRIHIDFTFIHRREYCVIFINRSDYCAFTE